MQRGKPVKLRPYQARIVLQSLAANTLVVLPTGAGKTLIAGELILRTGLPAVFLVPTVLLVSQQRKALEEWTSVNVQPYCGEMTLPKSFDILVSTPKAFEIAQANPANRFLQWRNLRCIVFDEVHHVLKNHPYRKLALSLKATGCTPYVLGLTASYTYAVGENKVKKALQTMCNELRISNLQTADDAELRASGYHALGTKSERPPEANAVQAPPGVLPREERKPHLMLDTFFNRIRSGAATPLCKALAKTVFQMEDELVKRDRSFRGPIQTREGMKEWGAEAHKRAAYWEMKRSVMFALYSQLEQWYEALRLLIVSWEESDFASVLLLRMFQCETPKAKSIWPRKVQNSITTFWNTAPTTFPRLDTLRQVLMTKLKERESFRGLLFVQQRITTHILEHFIANDRELSKHFSTACIYAASAPATPSFRVTKTQSAERLKAFAAGEVNLLIATVVAEEGMDVPAANCVIRFDAMHHAVSLVQGRGRARQADSSFVVLRERSDRPASVLEDTERQQRSLIQNFELAPSTDADKEKEVEAQKSRERAAKVCLSGHVDPMTALAKLNLFCTKTKTQTQVTQGGKKSNYETFIAYKSVLRDITGCGHGKDKKAAKRDAAFQTVMLLRKDFEENP